MDIVARDAVGTAHSNASVASSRMGEWLASGRAPMEFELRAVITLLTKALADALLAQHMLSDDWKEPSTYHGVWDRPADE